MTTAEILEFAMLFAFGFSWPFAIWRTYKAKRVDGKSPQFMFIVLFGYACGIAAHLVEGTKLWLCFVYLADMALVSADLALYFRYSARAGSRRLPADPPVAAEEAP